MDHEVTLNYLSVLFVQLLVRTTNDGNKTRGYYFCPNATTLKIEKDQIFRMDAPRFEP